MVPADVDGDGLTDLLVVGNDYGMEVQQGRADALMGLLLKNRGDGSFEPLNANQSGFYVPGDAKALVRVRTADGKDLWVASQNNNNLKAFEAGPAGKIIAVHPGETAALVTLPDGSKQRCEFYWGSGFLSQSERMLEVPKGAQRVEFFDGRGKATRTLDAGAL